MKNRAEILAKAKEIGLIDWISDDGAFFTFTPESEAEQHVRWDALKGNQVGTSEKLVALVNAFCE